MTRFEYLFGTVTDAGECTIAGEKIPITLLGDEGWELVSVGDWSPNVDIEVLAFQGAPTPMMTHKGVIARVVFKRRIEP